MEYYLKALLSEGEVGGAEPVLVAAPMVGLQGEADLHLTAGLPHRPRLPGQQLCTQVFSAQISKVELIFVLS